MRAVRMTSTLALALALGLGTPHTPAQESARPAGDLRYVILPTTDVRSGPSIAAPFYPTNRLHQGNAVEVVKERPDGWVAIRPPRDSFSWINTRFLHHIVPNQDNWVVVREGVEVPVLIGSELNKQKPTVVGARVERGTQVRSIGRPKADEDGTWMPIEPPPGEVRYVRTEALSRFAPKGVPAATLASARGQRVPVAALPARARGRAPEGGKIPPPNRAAPASVDARGAKVSPRDDRATFTPATPRPAAPRTVDIEGLWRQAERARIEGRWQEAIRLYGHLGTLGRYDRARAEQAQNLAHQLQVAWQEGRLGPERRFRPTAPEGPRPTSGRAAAAPAGRWSPAGRLRRAGRGIDGQQAWVLEDRQRPIPIYYLVPGRGVDLSPYEGLVVEVFGPVFWSGELRRYVLTAQGLRQVP
jgi:hypothetical protein